MKNDEYEYKWCNIDTPPEETNMTAEEAREKLREILGSLPTKEEEQRWLDEFYGTGKCEIG